MVALIPQENMVAALVSRTGRHLQRYSKGHRQVVGCIPYRYKPSKQTPFKNDAQELEVLVISSQKGNGLLFPKGGWELDESKEVAAARETLEEAGVRGLIEADPIMWDPHVLERWSAMWSVNVVQCELGKWNFKSKSHESYKEGYMFPLLVQEQLDFWPEKNLRQRIWMSVEEARKVCQHGWMKEALDRLVKRLTTQQQKDQGPLLKSRKENLIARILTSAFGDVLMETSVLPFGQGTLLWGSNKQEKSHN